MSTNFEVLNFLNLTNPRLGKLYKLTGYNPLPDGFVMSTKVVKERLLLGQLQCDKLPDFVFGSKKELKKRFKFSRKNIKNTLKNAKFDEFDADFVAKIEFYLNVRSEVTNAILKEFGKVSFDECDAYLEIYALDPIFADLLPDLFDENFDVAKISSDLEKKYESLKKARVKTLEKKETKKRKTADLQQEMVNQNVKSIKKSAKKEKTSNKTADSSQKTTDKNTKTVKKPRKKEQPLNKKQTRNSKEKA